MRTVGGGGAGGALPLQPNPISTQAVPIIAARRARPSLGRALNIREEFDSVRVM